MTLYFYKNEIFIPQAICALARSKQVKLDHSAIQMILPVMKYMQSVKQDFDALLKVIWFDFLGTFQCRTQSIILDR